MLGVEVIAMKVLLAAGALLVPVVLLLLRWMFGRMGTLLDLLAIACGYYAGIVIAIVVYDSIAHGMVLSTEVHKVLNMPLFLLAGSYLGNYGMYRLLLTAWREYRGR